jgi:hypothetical protein
MPNEQAKQKPAKTIRLGAVEASIWKNEGTNGRPNFSVTFRRSFKDGETWRDSDTYWSTHLPLLAKAADLAHTAILTELRDAPAKDSE